MSITISLKDEEVFELIEVLFSFSSSNDMRNLAHRIIGKAKQQSPLKFKNLS